MIVTQEGSQIYVGDIVEVQSDNYSHGKVTKFMAKVNNAGWASRFVQPMFRLTS